MSDTPRTDAVTYGLHFGPFVEALAENSRQLERELAAMTAAKNEALAMLRDIQEVYVNPRRSGIPLLDIHNLILKLEDME